MSHISLGRGLTAAEAAGILALHRGVAQLEAHRVWDAGVGGSSPPTPTTHDDPQATTRDGSEGNTGERRQASTPGGNLRLTALPSPMESQEIEVPGARVPSSNRRIDVIIVAAHYGPDRRLAWAQAYERRGSVWGDKVLLDRRALLEHLQRKKRVFTGEARALPGDFALGHAVELRRNGAGASLTAGAKTAATDDLGVPVL